MAKRGRPFGKSDFLEEHELKAVLAQPDRRSRQGLRDYAVLLILANTGMRKGELINLRREHLMDQGGRKFLRYECLKQRSKQPKINLIPLSAATYEAIQRYLDRERGQVADPSTTLFQTMGRHGPHGRRGLTAKAVDLIVRRAVRAAGITKRITPHSFRATFATRALTKGADLATVKELLGHSRVTSVEPYLRTNLERKWRAVEAVSLA